MKMKLYKVLENLFVTICFIIYTISQYLACIKYYIKEFKYRISALENSKAYILPVLKVQSHNGNNS